MENARTKKLFTRRNEEDSLNEYKKKFALWNKPMTAAKIMKVCHVSKSFEKDYLPRMREISFVLTIEADEKNLYFLKNLYGINPDKREKKYYFKTSATSEIMIELKYISISLIKLIDAEKINNLLSISRELSLSLRMYEFFKMKQAKITELENRELPQLLERNLILKKKVGDYRYKPIPIHFHKLLDDKNKLTLHNENTIKDYNYFNIIEIKNNGVLMGIKKLLHKNNRNKKDIEVISLLGDLCKKVTKILYFYEYDNKSNEYVYYLPDNLTFQLLRRKISLNLRNMAGLFNFDINIAKSDNLFKNAAGTASF